MRLLLISDSTNAGEEYLKYPIGGIGRFLAGLREGCMPRYEGCCLELIGSRPMRIFKKGQAASEVRAGNDLSFRL